MEDVTALEMGLSRGERLLWVGQPLGGLRLMPSDLVLVPFSLLWGGFALFWEFTVLRSNAPLLFRLWGMPFVLVGLYLIVGRFFFDAWRRGRTRYAVTDQRAIILSGTWSRQVRSISLRSMPELTVTQSRNGRGTITFGTASVFPFGRASWSSWPGLGGLNTVPAFESIEDPRAVHEIIRNAQLLAA